MKLLIVIFCALRVLLLALWKLDCFVRSSDVLLLRSMLVSLRLSA
jgi:hypothetical protein